jgi:hypothetical protein
MPSVTPPEPKSGSGNPCGGTSVLALAPWFIAAGVAIGCVETAEHAAVAALAPVELRGSAFGLLAAVQSFGNLAASAIAGLLWTAVSPRVAFAYLAHGWCSLYSACSPHVAVTPRFSAYFKSRWY